MWWRSPLVSLQAQNKMAPTGKAHTPKSQMFILFLSLFGVPNSIFRFPVQPPVWLDPCFCCVFEGALFHPGLYKEKPKGRSPYMFFCFVVFLGCLVFNKHPNQKVSHRPLVGPPLSQTHTYCFVSKLGNLQNGFFCLVFSTPKRLPSTKNKQLHICVGPVRCEAWASTPPPTA